MLTRNCLRTHARTHGRRTHRHDISPSGLWPVELKIIWKSANQFGRRRILKFFSFRCHGNQNSAWIPKIWRKCGEVIERMLSVKFHPNWPTGYWGEEVDARRTMDDGRRTNGNHNNSPWAKLRWTKKVNNIVSTGIGYCLGWSWSGSMLHLLLSLSLLPPSWRKWLGIWHWIITWQLCCPSEN